MKNSRTGWEGGAACILTRNLIIQPQQNALGPASSTFVSADDRKSYRTGNGGAVPKHNCFASLGPLGVYGGVVPKKQGICLDSRGEGV